MIIIFHQLTIQKYDFKDRDYSFLMYINCSVILIRHVNYGCGQLRMVFYCKQVDNKYDNMITIMMTCSLATWQILYVQYLTSISCHQEGLFRHSITKGMCVLYSIVLAEISAHHLQLKFIGGHFIVNIIKCICCNTLMSDISDLRQRAIINLLILQHRQACYNEYISGKARLVQLHVCSFF